MAKNEFELRILMTTAAQNGDYDTLNDLLIADVKLDSFYQFINGVIGREEMDIAKKCLSLPNLDTTSTPFQTNLRLWTMNAANHGQKDFVELLLPYAADPQGIAQTALTSMFNSIAIDKNIVLDTEIGRILVENGADVISAAILQESNSQQAKMQAAENLQKIQQFKTAIKKS